MIFIFHSLQPISFLNCFYFDQERHHEQNQQNNHTKQHTLEGINKHLKSAITSQFFNPTSHIYIIKKYCLMKLYHHIYPAHNYNTSFPTQNKT